MVGSVYTGDAVSGLVWRRFEPHHESIFFWHCVEFSYFHVIVTCSPSCDVLSSVLCDQSWY